MKTSRNDGCGWSTALAVIGGKWKTDILWELHLGRRRFGELRRLLPGISERILTLQLREMEADGIIRREVFAEVPPRVEYSVTEFGLTLNQAVTAMSHWGKAFEARAAGRDLTPAPLAKAG
jgi:DNA-binding HxlR family transcriptional regulator